MSTGVSPSRAPTEAEGMAALRSRLIEAGLADERMLERAARVAEENGARLDSVLAQLGIVSDRALAGLIAELLDLPLAGPGSYPETPVLPDRLRPGFLRRIRAIPLGVEDGTLAVAAIDPFDGFMIRALGDATRLRVRIAVAVPADLESALARLYPETEGAAASIDDVASDVFEDDAERLKDLASEAPVIRLVNQMIARAVEYQASDIHIQPLEDRLRVRFRFDGLLHEQEAPPLRLGAAITSRIKIMANLDIAERRLPQDGRLKLAVRGQEIDFRVSTVPSIHGETVVLRVLDRGAVTLEFPRLGFGPALTKRFEGLLQLANGMVLVTGPTGSGKTTTLYTGLSGIDSLTRNVITVEDPVEYQLPGVNQIQVKPQIGLSFAALLRAILRQDPDVIMVGEIRDIETAQIAVQAALTGHLVLSTLHTNTAAASIARLRDMGLEAYLMTAVLKGVLAQRLVRRLCPACAQSAPASPDLVRRWRLEERAGARPLRLFHPVGCPSCRGTGYRGRFAIAELLVPDEEIAHLIFSNASHAEIEQAAVASGMVTMFQSGLDAALDGVTSIEEVLRTLQAEG
jgi:general secretion pathway protein E